MNDDDIYVSPDADSTNRNEPETQKDNSEAQYTDNNSINNEVSFYQNTETTNKNESEPSPNKQLDNKDKFSSRIITSVLTIVVLFVSMFLLQFVVIFIPGLNGPGPAGFSVPNNFGGLVIIIFASIIAVTFYVHRD